MQVRLYYIHYGLLPCAHIQVEAHVHLEVHVPKSAIN